VIEAAEAVESEITMEVVEAMTEEVRVVKGMGHQGRA